MAETQGAVVSKALRGMLGAVGKPGPAVGADAVTGLKPLRKEPGLLCGQVLLLGHDRTLQHTRVSLLETGGFRCQCMSDGALPGLDNNSFKLIILCHTFRLAEACLVVAKVYLRSPSTNILRLAKEARIDEEACFQHVLVRPTPDCLIAMVKRLSHGPQNCC